jgi:hypothetical protein
MTRLAVRPDDPIDPPEAEGGAVVPLPVDLRALDAELEQSGTRARMMLHGRTQPTRYFAIDLRTRLLSGYAGADEPGGSGERMVAEPNPVPRAQLEVRRQPMSGGVPSVVARAAPPAGPLVEFDIRIALFVAALASAALILSAIGAGVIPR